MHPLLTLPVHAPPLGPIFHSHAPARRALPPEARSQQAVLFNKPRSGYSVLAASDAVGMGLNLNIRRVVFTSLAKFDGIRQRPLTAGETKQIAGRAGRCGAAARQQGHCQGHAPLSWLGCWAT